ncbi:MAG: MMPL family transporter [Candidatus Wallbacteria bacterium]|nr:MMPL family transporter [Candidatus Wallbacteria bacterium]
MSWRRRFGCGILRHERLLWAVLAVLCLASVAALPRLRLAFGFKGVMRQTHPDRVRLEAYEREFQLGDTLFVYFHGPGLFTPRGLRAVRDLSGRIERTEGVQRVFSAADIAGPAVKDDHLRLVRLLGADTLSSEKATREALAAPPFTDRWFGFLYDRPLTVLTMIVRPAGEFEDPRRQVGLLENIERQLAAFSSETGISYELNGLFYLNAEMIRSTFRDQGKLTLLGIGLLIACFWGLFGSLLLAVAVMAVLGVSILLAFGSMVLLGVPLNGLSGNLPVLTLVNGLEDVVHLLVLFFATRARAGARRSAASCARECVVPNFLTSLTTFGALIVTGATDMVLLQSFGWAIIIGVIVEYGVAIVFLPLVLARLPVTTEGALYYRLEGALRRKWLEPWFRLIKSRTNLLFWSALACALVLYGAQQRINSNWYRYFIERHPVTRTLGFLEKHDFPVSTIDCTIPVGLRFDELQTHPEVARDLERVAEAIRKLPGVVGVWSLADLKDWVDSRLDRVAFDPGLEERWKRARREAFYRQYWEAGAFDEYYSASGRKLRIAVATRLEDALGMQELGERIVAAVRPLTLQRLRGDQLAISGTMAYWSAIMGYVSTTFFTNVFYSVSFIFLVFLWVTRSPAVSGLAMIPNVLPIFVMFSSAKLLGYEINESFCVLDSLAIGNSVNDTIHYIFHVDANVRRGRPLPEALKRAFEEVGCAMVISSLLVAIGFLSCLGAEGVPVILSGVYMGIACVVAVAFDVFHHPAMLLRLGRWPR